MNTPVNSEKLSQAKTIGTIGSLLLLLTVVPSVGGVLGIIGFILILFAVKGISDTLGDRSIFMNMVWAIVLAIIGIIVGIVVIFGTLLSFIGLGNLSAGAAPATTDFVALLGGLAIGLLAIWVFYTVSAVFLKRTFDAISSRLNVSMFHTAALVYLIGAVTTIVLIGFALIFIAEILFLVAFISIPTTTTIAQPAQNIQVQR